MSWQQEVYNELRTGEWIPITRLFHKVEHKIELHFAIRSVASTKRFDKSKVDKVSPYLAKRYQLTRLLCRIGVDIEPPTPKGSRLKYPPYALVRIAPIRKCQNGHDMQRQTWSSIIVECPICKVTAKIDSPYLPAIAA